MSPDPLDLAPLEGGATFQAQLLSLQGEAVVVRSSRPFPPGARVHTTLTVQGVQHAFSFKVSRCRRAETVMKLPEFSANPEPDARITVEEPAGSSDKPGEYLVDARLFELRKHTRVALEALGFVGDLTRAP